MGRHSLSFTVISAVILFSVLWTPAYSDDKCSLGCKGTPSGPTFLNGHKYNYAVDGVVSIYLTGAEQQETSVKLLGQVSVSALGNCAYVLKVQNLAISGPDGKKYNKPNGLDKPVRFTLEDGYVGSDICTEEGDTRRSLNIKRAIISLLQSGEKPAVEVDVFGTCPTESSSSHEGSSVLVHRSRDLARCGYREHGRNDLVTAIYNPTAEIRNTQVLRSNLNIESKVNSGVPEKVSAIEEHLYKPFSVGENGLRAKVHTKLTLTGKAAGADNGQFTVPKTIIFENPHGAAADHSNLESVVKVVKETAKTLAHEASTKSAGNFAQLVRIMRSANKEDLLKAFAQVKGNNLEKRVFLDGLLRAGTGYSIDASIHLIKENQLNDMEQKYALLSLANAKNVNSDAIKSAAGLLDLPNLPNGVYLGVGALAGAYCHGHDCHHGKDQGVVALTNKLASKLNCKAKSKLDEDVTIAVLKGIKNIRHLEDSIIEKVIHCATDNGVKARVKVAALETFHADPCSAKIKKSALDILKNRQLDSEIRIKAYLAVIACPCGKSANEIKTLLDKEPVVQVGRFITTSLKHIRASANPDKALARQHYGQITTPRKFSYDDRKFSFYREVSYNIDALGLGGSAEQTVIYSQNSFLPRSASLNLTAELFGHNVNIFEIGARQGNLDRVVEHFLGPKGLIHTDNPQGLYDELFKRYEEASKKVQAKIRGRRSVKTDVDNFDKKVQAEDTPYDNELDMDIYVKLFGTDALFLSFGDDKGFDFNRVLDQILVAVDSGIHKAKKFQEEIRAHVLFLDAELAYATSTGLPLKLELIGSATGRLDASTNIDFKQIFKDPLNAKVDIKLIPSSDIEIAGQFLVDADAVATGLKVVTNLHSSTGTHVVAKLMENGQGFDLQLGLPVDKQEIVTASHDLVFFTAEKGQLEKQTVLKADVDRKDYSGCFDQLSSVIGLTLCGEVSVPFSVSGTEAQASLQKFFSRYPLTGATRLKLHLEKNDLKGYHVKGILRRNNPNKQFFEILFEAEGSKNRKTALSGELINTAEEKSLSLNLESPIKTLEGKVQLLSKPNEYVAAVRAKMDAEEYFARIGFNVQGNDQRKVFKPVAEYQLPGGQEKKSLKIDGQVIKEQQGPGTKYTFEGIKVNLPPSNEVVDINGHVVVEPKGYEADIKARKGEHNMLFSGALKGHEAKVEFQNTLNPYINFKVNAFSEMEKENIRNDIDLYYGGDLKNGENRVQFNQLLKYHKKSAQDFGFITKNKFHIHALPVKVVFDAEIDPKKVDIEVEGQYLDKNGKFELEARTNIKKPYDYSIKAEADYDKNGFEVFAKRDIVSNDKSNLENYIVIKNVGKYELSGVVMHKTKTNDVHIGTIGHLKVTAGSKKEDIKFDIGAIDNPNMYSSHVKVSRGKVDYVDYLMKINKGASPNGQLKFVLKDSIAANGQFKVTDADGKGNGMIIVDFKTAQRKIKGDVKFLAKDPVFNADIDLFLNFEKDNNDKIHISTNSKNTEKLLDSKNKLTYGGKKFELNLHKDGVLQRLGKVNGLVEMVLPDDRVLSFKVNRELTEKDNILNGHIDTSVSDETKRGGPASTVTYKAKISNSNFETGNFNYDGQVLLKLKDGKNLENSFTIKSATADNKKNKFDFKSDLKGSLIPKPASLVISTDLAVDSKLNNGEQKYRVKGAYGDDFNFEVDGSTDLQSSPKMYKFKDDATIQIHLPFEKAHDIKLVSNILYVRPENKDCEFSFSESAQLNSDVYKVDANGKVGLDAGHTKVKLLVPHVDPFSLDVGYKSNFKGEKKTGGVEIKSTYGKGKSANIVVDAITTPNEYTLIVKGNAPQAENIKKLELHVVTKTPSPDSFTTSAEVTADGRVYKSDVAVVVSKAQPLLDLKYSSPSQPKPSRIFVKGNSLSSNQGHLELKIENINDLSLDATSEGSIQKDNVILKLSANSEKLGLKNYKVDISSKDSGSGKRLELNAVNDNKNLFSGSTSFISKQEGPKTIIEGSGSVKVKEEQKSATFKYIRTVLTEGSEQGIETFMNVAIGSNSFVAESRVTNVEYKTSYVYCEEKKQCAHAELHSKLNVQKAGSVSHTVNVGVDLRKLGFAPEFGLQASSELGQDRLPQHSLDLHVNKEDKKYHLHVYSQPIHGKFPSGITITLPQRVLALETLVTYPTNKGLPFPIKAETVLHLDKNKPNLKSAVRMLIDVTEADKQHNAVAEFGFSHPKLSKEALVKFTGSLQVPAQNSVKISSAATISCPIVGSDRTAKFAVEASPVHIKLHLDTPLVEIINLEGEAKLQDKTQQADLKFSLLNGKPVKVTAIAKDFSYFEFSTGYSDEGKRKLSIIGHIDPEKRVDISADIILENEKKNIIHGAVFLQDNLFKTDYGVSKDNFNSFVTALKGDLHNLEGRIKQIGEKASEELKTTLKKVEPTITEINEVYLTELQKIAKELSNDQVLKEISQALDHIVRYLAGFVTEIAETLKPLVEKIQATISEVSKKILEIYEKQIEGQVKQIYTNLSQVIKELFEGLVDLASHYAALIADFVEKHKPELKELTNTLAEIFKDLTRLIVAQLKEFRGVLARVFEELTQQIKEMPIIAMIKEKFQELAVPDQVVGILQEAHQTIRQVLPTEESKVFADAVSSYVVKKLRQEKVDDSKELRAMYEKLAVALSSVIQFVRQQLNQLGLGNVAAINILPWVGGPQQSLPSFGSVPSFSIINQLIHGDIPDVMTLFRTYRLRSLNPLDEVPAKLRAVIVRGQHIFTFDGRHMTFPGTCRYVLAHDHVDRNFTIVMQLQNGAPKALLLEDKSGTTVELRENGQVAVNGAVHGFPVEEKDSFAFRAPDGRLGLGTLYGAMALCSPGLEVCYIEVSGFYLGKLRGLLGDGNNEGYDDFRLPNGKIVSDVAEFANAYRLSASCPLASPPEHSHEQHHAPLSDNCEKVFGNASPLRPLAYFLDVSPFRQACQHTASEGLEVACDLGRGYAALALTGLLPAALPTACVKCTDAGEVKEIGDTYELKVPGKQADVVVAVEKTKDNQKTYKEIIVPLVSQIVDGLKAKKIDDIKVHLIGITSRMPYPFLYDADNKLKGAKIQFDDETRYEHIHTIKTNSEKIDEYTQQIAKGLDEFRSKFGLTNINFAYRSLSDLPMRPGAVKQYIMAASQPGKILPLLNLARTALTVPVLEQNAAFMAVVVPTPDLKVGGGKNPGEIVGFDNEGIFFVGDKKKTKDAAAVVDFQDDSNIDFTLHTGGIVFSSTNFNALAAPQQKQFIQTASAAILERLNHETRTMRCSCVYANPFRGKSACIVEKKELAHRRK